MRATPLLWIVNYIMNLTDENHYYVREKNTFSILLGHWIINHKPQRGRIQIQDIFKKILKIYIWPKYDSQFIRLIN